MLIATVEPKTLNLLLDSTDVTGGTARVSLQSETGGKLECVAVGSSPAAVMTLKIGQPEDGFDVEDIMNRAKVTSRQVWGPPDPNNNNFPTVTYETRAIVSRWSTTWQNMGRTLTCVAGVFPDSSEAKLAEATLRSTDRKHLIIIIIMLAYFYCAATPG